MNPFIRFQRYHRENAEPADSGGPVPSVCHRLRVVFEIVDAAPRRFRAAAIPSKLVHIATGPYERTGSCTRCPDGSIAACDASLVLHRHTPGKQYWRRSRDLPAGAPTLVPALLEA